MTPSDSSYEEQEKEAPLKAKRSKPEEATREELIYHPVKLSRSDLYRPPTAEELNQLKEAESLFHCSLLKMQVRPLTYWMRRMKIKGKGICLKSSLLPHVNSNHTNVFTHLVMCIISSITDGGAAERGRPKRA